VKSAVTDSIPKTTDYSLFYYFLLWFTLLAAAVTFMFIHGIEYVSWPRLNPLTDFIYYNGPGFRSARHGMGLNSKAVPSWRQPKFFANTKRKAAMVENLELGEKKRG
jgi:hypothetical protein